MWLPWPAIVCLATSNIIPITTKVVRLLVFGSPLAPPTPIWFASLSVWFYFYWFILLFLLMPVCENGYPKTTARLNVDISKMFSITGYTATTTFPVAAILLVFCSNSHLHHVIAREEFKVLCVCPLSIGPRERGASTIEYECTTGHWSPRATF